MIILIPFVLVAMEIFYHFIKSLATKISYPILFQRYIIYVVATFQNLVEQGFIEKSSSYFGMMSSCILLIAVILSNAYKCGNITKIISPLPPIPFREFKDLVRNNFNIYSSPTQHLDFIMTGLDVWKKYQKCKDCYTKLGTHCFRSVIIDKNGNTENHFRINSALFTSLDYST